MEEQYQLDIDLDDILPRSLECNVPDLEEMKRIVNAEVLESEADSETNSDGEDICVPSVRFRRPLEELDLIQPTEKLLEMYGVLNQPKDWFNRDRGRCSYANRTFPARMNLYFEHLWSIKTEVERTKYE